MEVRGDHHAHTIDGGQALQTLDGQQHSSQKAVLPGREERSRSLDHVQTFDFWLELCGAIPDLQMT
jgi:hypothetical protein